jgi:hypothetical protein
MIPNLKVLFGVQAAGITNDSSGVLGSTESKEEENDRPQMFKDDSKHNH